MDDVTKELLDSIDNEYKVFAKCWFWQIEKKQRSRDSMKKFANILRERLKHYEYTPSEISTIQWVIGSVDYVLM